MSATDHDPAAADTDIEVGHHITVTIVGLTFNLDTIWSTVLAGSDRDRARASGSPAKSSANQSGQAPDRLGVDRQLRARRGREHARQGRAATSIQLAIALFTFILVANWLELIPSGEDPKPAAADRRRQPDVRARRCS